MAGALGAAGAGCLAPTQAPRPLAYQSFMPTPAALGAGAHYAFYYRDDAVIRGTDQLAPATARKYGRYLETVSPFGTTVPVESVEASVQLVPSPTAPEPRVTVLRGSFDAFERGLRDQVGRPTVTDGGSRWVSEETGVHVAGDTALVVSARAPEQVFEAVFAAHGGADRYQDASPTAARLLEAVGAGHDVNGYTHPPTTESEPPNGIFAGEVARGHRYRFEGATARSTYTFVFDASAPRAQLEEWVTSNGGPGRFGVYENPTVTVDGRVGRVDGRLPTREV